MSQGFSKFLLNLLGWKVADGIVPDAKCIILGVPHTSIWDFLIAYLFYRSVGGYPRVMVKKESFKWPLGRLLKSVGAIPVDRTHGTGLVKKMIDEFASSETLHLCIAPEGTRKAVKRWKTGFHTIAHAAKVPVYLGYFDWKNKIVGRGIRFEVSEDVNADLLKIQKYYKDLGVKGKYPENVAYLDKVE